MNRLEFPAITIKREFENLAIAGRKRWEVLRRPLPLGKPIGLVVDGRLSSFAVFSHGVTAMPAHLQRHICVAAGGGDAVSLGVAIGSLFDFAKGRDLFAYEYDAIVRAELARGVHALFEDRIVSLTSYSRRALENWQGRLFARLMNNLMKKGGAE